MTVAVLAIGVNVLGSQQRKFRQRVRDLVMPAICQAVGELRHSAGEAADIPFDELERICATGALFRISPLIRDKIIHSGSLASPIFVTEKGFCVSPQDKPFADFGIWHESHYYHKNLVSLLPLVAHMVSRPSALAMILGAITQRDMILAADGCCAVT